MKLILAAALALAATQASATCLPREEVLELIKGPKYEEHLHARGLSSPTQLLELFVNEDTGTWTILITRPDGTSCHMASGQEWQPAPKILKGTNL